jgi:hypothetical protein
MTLNDTAGLIFFAPSDAPQAALDAFTAVAEEVKAADDKAGDETTLNFFLSQGAGRMVDQIKGLLQADDAEVLNASPPHTLGELTSYLHSTF